MSNTTLPRYQSAWAAGATTPQQVLDFHRATFGDFRMEANDDGDDGGEGGDGTDPGDDDGDDDDSDDETIDALPEDQRARVTRVMRDARTRAKSSKRRAAAEKARADRAESELATLRQANETDHEKALREARTEGRKEAAVDSAKAMLRMALRAVGVSDEDDVADAVDNFNIAGAVAPDGAIDDERIGRYASRFRAAAPSTPGETGNTAATGSTSQEGARDVRNAFGPGKQAPPKISAKEAARAEAIKRGWVRADSK